ncbi:MAG TPA: hypothetical protein VNN22_26440 [Verrucomicrobiae bacterium]|nr:hypothetical protein [Verrucomicrobiae bacterium]
MFNFEKLETWQKAIAAGSLFEVVSRSFVGERQGFLSKADFNLLYAAVEEQGRMLSGLRRAVLEGS